MSWMHRSHSPIWWAGELNTGDALNIHGYLRSSAATDICISNVLSQAQRKPTMLDERAQQRLIAGDRTRCLFRAFEELGQLAGREGGQRVHLGVAPDQFHGIELGGVARPQVGARARGGGGPRGAR